jgi:putative protein kinase ArgK-like GTPase of G3E family
MSTLKEQRLKANRELAEILIDAVENMADQRFSQILQNLGFVKSHTVHTVGMTGHPTTEQAWRNEFYLEPMDLLRRVKSDGT